MDSFINLLMLSAFLGSIALFLLRIRRDWTDKSAIWAIRLLVIITMSYWVILAVAISYRSLNLDFDRDLISPQIIFLVLHWLSIFIFIHSFFDAHKILLRKISIARPDDVYGRQSIELEVDAICREMEIKNNIRIVFSSNAAIPQVFGSWNGESTLVLPEDIDELLERFVETLDNDVSDIPSKVNIRKYLLLHELSHIKNGDAFFTHFVRIITRYLSFFLGFLVASTAITRILVFYDKETFGLYSYLLPTLLLIIPYIILLGSSIILSRLSEYLADATAARYMPSNATDQLTETSARRISILEYLFVSLSIFHQQRIKKRRPIRKIRRHPKGASRGDVLNKNRYIPDFPTPKIFVMVGLWFGLICALHFWVTELLDIRILYEVSGITIVILYVVLPIIYSVVWKNLRLHMGVGYLELIKRILPGYLLSFTAFLIIFTLIHLGLAYYNGRWNIVGMLLLSIEISAVTHIVMFSLSLALMTSFKGFDIFERGRTKYDQRILNNIKFYILGFAPSLILFIKMLPAYSGTDQSFINRIHYVTCVLAIHGLLKIVFALDRQYEEAILLMQFRNRKIVLDPIKLGIPWDVACVSIGFIDGVIYFAIPAALGYVAYIVIHSYLSQNLLLSGFVFYILLLLTMGYRVMHIAQLSDFMFELTIKKMMNMKMSEEEKGEALTLLRKNRASDGSYINRVKKLSFGKCILGTMEGTSAGLVIHYLANETIDSDALNWILSMESINGGFSVTDGAMPDPGSTFKAIEALHKTDLIRSIKYPREHIKFILGNQSKSGGFKHMGMETPDIEATYQALFSLNTLGADSKIIANPEKFIAWIISEWKENERKSKIDFEKAYYFAYCLKWFDAFDYEKRNMIAKDWFPKHDITIQNLTTNINYQRLYYYIKLLELLGIQQNNRISNKIREFVSRKQR